MVLLPEEAEMTLAELRQMAARQQQQIEAQQQLLAAKEQRLKFLKQQEARHHNLADQQIDRNCIQSLRDKVEAQELKLRHLRALRGQVEQQKTNNGNLGAELQSIRALFSEKEKELNLSMNKVEELTRQLDIIRNHKNKRNSSVPNITNELENLKRELAYRTQLAEQQNSQIMQQRQQIAQKQQDVASLDSKIEQLTQRLHRKRLLNQQLANQIHNAALARHSASSVINTNAYSLSNIAAVEPIQRELQEPEHTQDDLSAKLQLLRGDLSEFSPKKNDPKYQTLPYNTKFSLKGKQNIDDTSHHADDESSSCSSDNSSSYQKTQPITIQKQNHNMCNFAPRPFGSMYNSNNHVQIPKIVPQHQIQQNKNSGNALTKPMAPVKALIPKSNIPISTTTITEQGLSEEKLNHSATLPLGSMHLQEGISKSNGSAPLQSSEDIRCPQNKNSLNTNNVNKPAVPPKPAFPIKPIPPPRQTSYTKEQNNEQKTDIISMALSVLQNKSTEKEKSAFSNYRERLLYYQCIPRYPLQSSSDKSSSESKVVTYFPKPSSNDSKHLENGNLSESIKRKPSSEHLPIKPKPLTIRKTPGLEPPKLKVQQNTNIGFHRKSQEHSILTTHLKPIVISSVSVPTQQAEKVQCVVSPSNELNAQNATEFSRPPFENKEYENINSTKADDELDREKELLTAWEAQHIVTVEAQDDNENSESSDSPTDSLEYEQNHDGSKSPENTEVENENVDSSDFHITAVRRINKGNLKTEGSVRNTRRVSFDPLALLLDAALEGELDLVKKTAAEVPNPSAANDEGITALHNAICAGYFEVVTFLVEFGCDVNAQDSDGWTPLHCAASCNNLPMVKFLVERGACIFATTLSDHETAAEKCEEEEEGFDGCSEYLYGLQENLGIMNDGIVYAVYDYEGQNSDELSFNDGDKITVLRNGDEQENEWWWARLADQEGYIPRNLLGLYPRITSKKT